ncbi:MAG: dethiobiotin synthase [Proteobacteria bacterium]|nr:dethiobiotin synthase [Pseudomonadota bacterium]
MARLKAMGSGVGKAGLFITASGTGAGKTLIACALCHQLRARGLRVQGLKPVISGFDPAEAAQSDTGLILRSLGREISDDSIAHISPFRFAAPLAPNMAAKREGREIDLGGIVDFCRRRADDDYDVTLIEGVGGVMAPITDEATVIDWMAALGFPALVVLGSYLGAISHGLTALGALAARAIPIAGIIVNESSESPVDLAETADNFRRFLPGHGIVAVPRIAPVQAPWQRVPDLTGLLPAQLTAPTSG